MSEASEISKPDPELSEQERTRIRSEIRYTMLAAQEASLSEKTKSTCGKILGYLSNGFVLLLIGSLITSVLVPRFQRQHESRLQKANLMQECLTQFLLYSNSIWREYYEILPLSIENEIDKEVYLKYLDKIAKIKLKRYNSFAKVEALAIVFRASEIKKPSFIENELETYAINFNKASTAIDKWLSSLYCTPYEREDSPCASFDPEFDAFIEYEKIKKMVVKIGNEDTDEMAAMIVKRISNFN